MSFGLGQMKHLLNSINLHELLSDDFFFFCLFKHTREIHNIYLHY